MKMSLDNKLGFSDSNQMHKPRDEQGGTWGISHADRMHLGVLLTSLNHKAFI